MDKSPEAFDKSSEAFDKWLENQITIDELFERIDQDQHTTGEEQRPRPE